jgi:hypothetical protein
MSMYVIQHKHVRKLALALACAWALIGTSSGSASASETKSYLVNWFYLDNYYGGDEDCPQGLNPSSIEFYRRDLLRLGYTKAQVDKLLDGYPGPGDGTEVWVPYVSHRGNGKDDVYENPTTAPDPGLKIVQGRYAYGFNLDGRGANSPSGFEDPETHEKGINNELYRLIGCIKSFRGGQGASRRPAYSDYMWDVQRDRMPGWLISITSESGKDGDATVTFARATRPAIRDASGVNSRANMTYVIDPDPRGHSIVQGKIKDGVLTTTLPSTVRFISDAFGLTPDLELTGARVRFKLNADGTLSGVIGGYQHWTNVYWGLASRSWASEYLHSQDAVAIYYALRRMADANPDPKTGQNRDISCAYAIEAVPAFAVTADALAKPESGSQAR